MYLSKEKNYHYLFLCNNSGNQKLFHKIRAFLKSIQIIKYCLLPLANFSKFINDNVAES